MKFIIILLVNNLMSQSLLWEIEVYIRCLLLGDTEAIVCCISSGHLSAIPSRSHLHGHGTPKG